MSIAAAFESEFKRISVRDLNKSQRRAVSRIYRLYVERNSSSGCTSVRFELRILGRGLVAMTLDTRRSDCDKHSQRQIICHDSFHGFIGPRGAIRVSRAEVGIGHRNEAHVASMVGGTVNK